MVTSARFHFVPINSEYTVKQGKKISKHREITKNFQFVQFQPCAYRFSKVFDVSLAYVFLKSTHGYNL